MKAFDTDYFKRYRNKNIFRFEKGERPFLYSFWMRKLKKLIRNGSRILEVGCGLGYFLKRLEKEYNVFGIDISEEAIEIAKKKSNALLMVADAQKLPFKNDQFDAIIAFDVIEHLKKPENFLKEANRTLKLNGILIIATPNLDSFGNKIKKYKSSPKKMLYENKSLEWYGCRDETHISLKPIKEWQELINTNNFLILNDGTDTLWDIPYFKVIPNIIQKLIFIIPHWILTFFFGFFFWKYGENYICIAKKVK